MQLPIPDEFYSAPDPFARVPNPRLGIPASAAQAALQSDAYKELVNKLAWCLGSSYRVPYTNVRTLARRWAIELARKTFLEHGFPSSIAYPE